MDGIWGNFSTTDQARMLEALQLQQLPDPNQLTAEQLQTLDKTFGYNISVQILAYDVLQDLQTPGGGNAGEPQLPAPELGDASDLASMLAVIQEKLGKLQVGTAQEAVKANKLKMERLSQERLEKIKESIEKLEKASKSGLLGKIFGWIGAIVGVIAAAVATVATGGAAAPALAVALVGLTLMVLEETGAMEKIVDFLAKNPAMLMLVFGPIVGGVLFALAKEGVLDEDKLKMAIQVTIAAEMLVASIASMVISGGASASQSVGIITKIAAMTGKTAQQVANAAKLFGVAAQGIGAAVSIGGGAAGIASAAYGYQATMSQAESKEFLAWLAKIQSQLEDEQEGLKKAIEALQSDMSVAAEILGSIHKSKEAVIGRLGTA